MRRDASRVVVALAATFWVVSPALAGIDETYLKPAGKKSWGELLLDFVGHPGFGKSYALVVGISKFDDFSSLPTANDPIRVRDFLINEAGFDYVHVLTDDKATKARIDELMVDVLPTMIDKNDQFLFYWSGHGEQRPNARGGDVGYLPLANSPTNRYSTMISMGDVQRWDDLLRATQALFLLDACFSGLAGHKSLAGPRDLVIDQLAKPAHHVISAGTGEEKTIASDRWGGSIFTDAILRAVRGEADAETTYPRDGVVSLTELVGYVKQRVAIEAPDAGWTRPITPQIRDLRTNDGEFFFLTNDRKVAKLEGGGAKYQGRFEYGMPLVIMGKPEGGACDQEAREADRLFFDAIKDEARPDLFEAYLKKVDSGDLCGLFAEIVRARLEQPAPAQLDPAAAEALLDLRPEDRTVVQQALSALGFDSGVPDGVFGALSRRAIAGWQRTQDEEPTGYLTALQYPRVLVAALDQDPAEQGDLRVAQRELSERRANLDTDVRALESQRKRLAEDQATQTRDVDAEAELREQHAALDEREAELARRSEELNRRIAEIESRASEIEHEQNQLTQPTPETQGSDRPLQEEDVINFGRYYALVIGNADYQYSQDLRSPEADAMAISALLTEKYDFTVIPLINASRNEILEALHRLKETLNEGDNLLIYYAGHSVRDESNGRGYWLPVDAESYPETAKWISTDDITDILDSMHARHVMVMADSYYSGSLTSNYDSPLGLGVPQEERPYWLQTIANKPARMALTSGNLSPVLDGGGGQHSIFAKALLEVLGTNDRVMEGWRVYLRVSARVSDVAQVYGLTQVPTYGPIESGKYAGGDFLFVPS